MPLPALANGLVLQGGGALGAFELGAARAIYSPNSRFTPDIIAGVSIGAITAVLLARPVTGMTGLQALEAFWRQVRTIDPRLFPATALIANPPFYVPAFPPPPFGSSVYDTRPLLGTLGHLVDTVRLKDPEARPRLLLSAVDIASSSLETFDSAKQTTAKPLTLAHVLASGSLPPNFPATVIGGKSYWDGGVFDNTPLGAVIDALKADQPTIVVINLFPKQVPVPKTIAEVIQTFTNILFVNKTESDWKLMQRFNAVVDFVEGLKAVYPLADLRKIPGWGKVSQYRRVTTPIQVTRCSEALPLEASDFSDAGIEARAAEGESRTITELQTNGLWA